MGIWGTSVKSDDTVLDILGFISDKLKSGKSLNDAIENAKLAFRELRNDKDEEPVFWLAIASAQWKYQGFVEQALILKIRNDITNEHGLERWREDSKALAKRKEALAKFLIQIQQANPKPSKPPKLIIRNAPYKAGDCLSVQLKDGRYTALLVLKVDNDSNPEYGSNLIIQLDYLHNEPPDINIFKKKNWLIRNQGPWKGRKVIYWYLPSGYKKVQNQITLIGNIRLGWLTPKSEKIYRGWHEVGDTIINIHNNPEHIT